MAKNVQFKDKAGESLFPKTTGESTVVKTKTGQTDTLDNALSDLFAIGDNVTVTADTATNVTSDTAARTATIPALFNWLRQKINGLIDAVVRHDTATQGLTTTQQSNARTNIGAGTVTSVSGNNGLTGTVTSTGNIGMAAMAANTVKGNSAASSATPTDITMPVLNDRLSSATVTAKATPVDADSIIYTDSAASNVAKRATWANIKAFLKTYFDTLYDLVMVTEANAQAGTQATATSWTAQRVRQAVNAANATGTFGCGVCIIAAGTAAKTVSVPNWRREIGSVVEVYFSATNTAASPTLNVNGTGASAIHWNGVAPTANMITLGRATYFMWNGSNWLLLNPATGETNLVGTVTTAVGTAAKVGTLANFTRTNPCAVILTFSNNPTSLTTLNVNSTGASTIRYNGVQALPGHIKANHPHVFIFDGSSWNLQNPIINGESGFGTCATAVGTTAKVGVVRDFYFKIGATVSIRFNNGNSVASPTLNINTTGAFPLRCNSKRI